ncbi:hypothetical protein LCGC14_2939200 [marine sediment metagenome]|uniref:Uncharacterized protein n=1 Tax=marine sediment metagenome TaxID=412755 RepID=A0A0F8ZR99_9ZZZZ
MAEEDIELTEDEIGATRLALRVFCGLLLDIKNYRDAENLEEYARWQETYKEQAGIDPDCNLNELLVSALT